MNHGFFSFPSSQGNEIIDIKEFDTSSAYYIPQNAKRLFLFAVGGGGGGAGGWRSATNGAGGGTGGMAGNIVLTEISTKMFAGVETLNIIIGSGGTAGTGSASNGASPSDGGSGGATQIWIPGRKSYFISAAGSQYGRSPGSPASSSSQAPSGLSVGMSLLFGVPIYFSQAPYTYPNAPSFNTIGLTSTGFNNKGAQGGWNSVGYAVVVNSPYGCGGAGGGTVNSSTGVATAGGAIRILSPTSDFETGAGVSREVVSFMTDTKYAQGDTVYSGGAINTATAPLDATELICSECMFSAGFGGAGGGGGASTSANNGAKGYRGGGGAGGGGSKGVTAGNGGAGGNGYVKIITIG
jgi:hypothetical protein